MRRGFRLITALVLPQLAGLIGGLFTFSAINEWYQFLAKPSFSPPNWLFGPVWTALYLMMGLAWYLAWRKGAPAKLFLIHLVFNCLWSILFFGLKSPGLAFLEILVLWTLIVALLRQFYRFNRLSSWLLVPYLLWVSFAAILNFSVWRLNPGGQAPLPHNPVVFIRAGNLWAVETDGSNLRQITNHEPETIAADKHRACGEFACGTYDPESWYNRDFFEHPSLSPDGTWVAAMGYSQNLKTVIETNNEEIKREYLAGDYWIPAHHDLYVVNLKTGEQKQFPLEDNPLDKDERIERLYWQRDNQKVFLISVSGRLFSVDLKTGKIEASVNKLFAPDSFHYAYLPEVKALLTWESAGWQGNLQGYRLWELSAPVQSLVKFAVDEYSSVIAGINGRAYLWTREPGMYRLFEYQSLSKNNATRQIFSAAVCSTDEAIRPCIALPGEYGGLGSDVVGSVSPHGKYFFGQVNITFEPETAYESWDNDIYRLSDLTKVFDYYDQFDRAEFAWGLDGESLVAEKDGDLFLITLADGGVKQLTNFGDIESYFGFDWNYLN